VNKPSIRFDLTGPEFIEGSVQAWPHTHPEFERLLKKLHWHTQWKTIYQDLMIRYAAYPKRPHCVHEAFLRGKYGYVPMILAATSPEGKIQIRGLLYRCTMNLHVPSQQRRKALYDLGASGLTQWLAQSSGDPNFMIKWEKP
jgi:hypothetical protein